MAEDLSAKFVRINAAKKAAADLRVLCSGCKTAFLREEGALFVNEALDVIKTVEDMVSSTSYRDVTPCGKRASEAGENGTARISACLLEAYAVPAGDTAACLWSRCMLATLH